MEELELFILRIPKFKEKTAAELIDYFAYFLLQEKKIQTISAIQIKQCFIELSIQPYSNISAYLSKNSAKQGKYIKQKSGYTLSRLTRKQLATSVNDVVIPPVSNNLIDLSIFDQTPYYIKAAAKEMIHCYDAGFYNATLVLMRKLTETLIIECFERYGFESDIKDSKGVFFYLSDLIPHFLNCPRWNASRNINKSLLSVKHFGDLSAHNRRYLAKKSDIDNMKIDLRQALQEIVLIIDYPNWKNEQA